jgi:broad specificity phosphatase PhoE
MRIFLLRHGATDWNEAGRCQGLTDLELNNIGRAQAAIVARMLAGETLAAVYSSHLARARQTAAAVSLVHGLEVAVEENLHELDHGHLEGLTFDEIKKSHRDFIRVWRERPAEAVVPGGELLVDVAERAWQALGRIVARHRPDDTLVVVSHNFPILSLVCRILGTPLNQYRTYHVPPGGHVCVEYAGGAWRLLVEDGRLPLRKD